VEKPMDSELQNNIETNITNEGVLVEPPSDTFDSFFKDFEVEEHDNDKCNPTTAESSVHYTVQPSVQSQNTKQSLFIRLANRIKVILNIKTLIGIYNSYEIKIKKNYEYTFKIINLFFFCL